MSNPTTNTTENPVAFVRYGRKRPTEQYGSSEASVSIPIPLDEVTDAAISTALETAQVAVLDTLGIEYEAVDGKIVEKAVVVVAAPAAPTAAAAAANVGNAFGGSAVSCGNCGGDVWDNRQNKRNPKGPDYKCKKCGSAAWLNDDGSVGNWKS